jgi:hypothetical protein
MLTSSAIQCVGAVFEMFDCWQFIQKIRHFKMCSIDINEWVIVV